MVDPVDLDGMTADLFEFLSSGMTLLFLGLCLGIVWWISKKGYR